MYDLTALLGEGLHALDRISDLITVLVTDRTRSVV